MTADAPDPDLPATTEPPASVHSDDHMRRIDVQAAIIRDLTEVVKDPSRQAMYPASAIAAALAAEDLHVRPYPLSFLARFIRTAGLKAAQQLPEPLIRPSQADLVRGWMRAAARAPAGIRRDDAFAQWLQMVAALLAIRRRHARSARDRPIT